MYSNLPGSSGQVLSFIHRIWCAGVSVSSVAFVVCLQLSVAISAAEPPRVLILGDSIYSAPSRLAATELKDRVEIVYATMQPGEVRNTATALVNLDRWLGDGDWDLIHFNFGLGDLVYRAPGMKSFRVLPKGAGGIRATSAEQYEKDLRLVVKQLKATGAVLVWASTTPIRHSSSDVFAMGSEVKYNAIAARVMAEEHVPINDMYSHVKSLIDMTKPASHGADPFFFDRQPLHPPVIRSILSELKLPPQSPVKKD